MEKYMEFVMLGYYLDLYENGETHIDWDNIDTDAMYARMDELQDEFLEPYVIDNGVTALSTNKMPCDRRFTVL